MFVCVGVGGRSNNLATPAHLPAHLYTLVLEWLCDRRRRHSEPPRCAAAGKVCEFSFAVLFSFTSRELQLAELGGMLGLELCDGGWAGPVYCAIHTTWRRLVRCY